MAWKAKLLRLSKAHGRIEFEIKYSDGIGTPINKSYSFERINKAEIRALARREAARLQEVKDQVIGIAVNQEIDLTPPPDPPSPMRRWLYEIRTTLIWWRPRKSNRRKSRLIIARPYTVEPLP